MKNLFNLTLMCVSLLCMVGVLTGVTSYDTTNNLGDKLMVGLLWFVVSIEYLSLYLKSKL